MYIYIYIEIKQNVRITLKSATFALSIPRITRRM